MSGGGAATEMRDGGMMGFRPLGMQAGGVPVADVDPGIRDIFQGLVDVTRSGSTQDVAAYIESNRQDLNDMVSMMMLPQGQADFITNTINSFAPPPVSQMQGLPEMGGYYEDLIPQQQVPQQQVPQQMPPTPPTFGGAEEGDQHLIPEMAPEMEGNIPRFKPPFMGDPRYKGYFNPDQLNPFFNPNKIEVANGGYISNPMTFEEMYGAAQPETGTARSPGMGNVDFSPEVIGPPGGSFAKALAPPAEITTFEEMNEIDQPETVTGNLEDVRAALNSPFARAAALGLAFTPAAPVVTAVGFARDAANAYDNITGANRSRAMFGLPNMDFIDAGMTGLGFNNFDFTDQERTDIAGIHGTVGDVGAPGAPGALGALGLDPDFAAYEAYSASAAQGAADAADAAAEDDAGGFGEDSEW